MFHPCLRFYSLKPQLRPDGQSPTATRAGEKLHLESGQKADKTARVLDQVLRWQDLAVIRKGLQNLYAWVRFPPAPPTQSRCKYLAYCTPPPHWSVATTRADWLRREIETALANQRNTVPLMLEGFDFD